MTVTVSNDVSTVTGELLRLIAKTGQNMTAAMVIYQDGNDDVYWYGSEDLEKSDAIDLMEKVKAELLREP